MSEAEVKKAIADLPSEGVYNLSLRKEDIELKRKRIPIKLLTLDPKNQRIQFLMTSKGFGLTDAEIEEELWKQDYVKQLANSILDNGGLLSPIIVQPNGVVVEGNSRLVACRRLIKISEEKKITPPPDVLNLPAEVLPEGLDDKKLVWLLGEWHIAGKHEWDPYEQAEYIYKMWKDEGQTYDTLVNHLRMSKSTIRQKINAYEMMRDYLTKNRSPQEIYKWSYFEEYFKKKDLRERHILEPDFKEKFFELVAAGGVKGEDKAKFQGADVRKLPEVLEIPEAWAMLQKTKDFRQAYEIVVAKKDKSALTQSIKNCIHAFDTMETKDFLNLQQAVKADQSHPTANIIRELYDKIEKFADLIGIDLDSQ